MNFRALPFPRLSRAAFFLACATFAAAAGMTATTARAQSEIPADPGADVRSRLHLADELVREKKHAEALELYREVARSRPDDPRLLAGMKACLLELKGYEELVGLLRREHERWPEDPSALEQLGTVSARQGDRESAARWWREILVVQEKSRGSYELVADLFVRNRMLDEAMATYAQADSAYPGDFTRPKANLHELRFEFDAATREYLNYLESNPTALSFVEGRLLRIGESEGGLGAVIERVRAAAARHDAHPEPPKRAPLPAAPRIDGPLKLPGVDSFGRLSDDRDELEQIFYGKLLGDLQLEARDYEGASREYLRLASESPEQIPALLVFAKRCQTDGAHEVAIRVFEQMIELGADPRVVPGAMTEIARSQVELRRWDDALATKRRIQEEFPETSYALAARFESAHILLEGKGLPEEAEAIYRELLPMSKGPWGEADPQFGIAECALWKDDFGQARGILTAIRERDFTDVTRERALYEEANAFLYSGDFAQADSLFKRVAAEFPKGEHVNDALSASILVNTNRDAAEVLAKYGTALHRLRIGRSGDAAAILEGIERDTPDAAIADETALLLGRAWRDAGDAKAALSACDRAIGRATVPDLAADARLLKGEIYGDDLKDTAAALAEYEELLVGFPETLAADVARERVGILKRAIP